MAEQKKERRVIQSVERAVSILDYLTERPKGERLTVLSRELGLNKSTAFTLISSLEELGLVGQDLETGRYSLGLRLLQYGLAVQNQMDLVRVAQPYLDQLSMQCGETSHMAVLAKDEIVYVAKSEGTKAIRMVTQIGARMPAYCSALGKVLMAYLPEEERQAMVAGITFRPYTPATILDGAALLEELAQVRRQGYAYDREEREAGLFCVSAPILTAGGTCAAAVSVSLPAGRIGQHDVGELTRAVCQAAGEISARLGSR